MCTREKKEGLHYPVFYALPSDHDGAPDEYYWFRVTWPNKINEQGRLQDCLPQDQSVWTLYDDYDMVESNDHDKSVFFHFFNHQILADMMNRMVIKEDATNIRTCPENPDLRLLDVNAFVFIHERDWRYAQGYVDGLLVGNKKI